MKRLLKTIVVMVLLGGWAVAFSAIHVVRTRGQLPVFGDMLPNWGTVHVFTKQSPGFRETFADIRNWTLHDIAEHPAVTIRMMSLGFPDELAPLGSADQINNAIKGEIRNPYWAADGESQPHQVMQGITPKPANSSELATPTSRPSDPLF